MIYTVPVITSKELDRKSLAVVAKSIEAYCLIYRLDTILKHITRSYGLSQGSIKKNLQVPKDKAELFLKNITESKNRIVLEQGIEAEPVRPISPKLGSVESLGIEPTWIIIEVPIPPDLKVRTGVTGKKGEKREVKGSVSVMLGIKAMFFPVTNTRHLTPLLLKDATRRLLVKLILIQGRAIQRAVLKLTMKVIRSLPLIKKLVPNIFGDPMKDIIMGLSTFEDIFVAVSKQEVEEKNLFENPKVIRSLQRLGWPSIIIIDEVDQIVHFCMKEFKGMCSIASFSSLYATIGKTEVYKDASELRRSPIFSKLAVPLSRIK